MTRSFFSSVGGFNVNMETGEDYDFCQKAVSIGGRICEVPDLKVVHHDYPKTIKAFVLRERWHGSGDVSALKKVMKSKVALASLLFILLHFFCVLFLFIDPLLSFFVLTLLLAFLVFLSFRKFKRKGAFIIFTNTFYYYFYFVGRSASFTNLLKIRKK
jgi:cellulose synthase/poly-beta-1,6-N-acetylglucosamine synthase-like glycosyltransferase